MLTRRMSAVPGALALLAALAFPLAPAAISAPAAPPASSAAPASPASPAAASPAAVSPEAAAVRAARQAKHAVTVDALTTSTRRVQANPDGTFTAELSDHPVRARHGSGWAPIDTTLGRRTDGKVVPAVPATPVEFSGGGSGPLVTIGAAGARVTLTWPAPLPTPVMRGSTATYPGVWPGVDLRLTATPAGYSETLIVRSRAAAANPALRHVHFGVHTDGLTLRPTADGGFDAINRHGTAVLSSPGAAMWDAGRRHVAHATTRFTPSVIDLAPDPAFLADPTTRYPVAIDPDTSPTRIGWTKVFSGHPDTSYWNGAGDDSWAKVGYCGWDGCEGIGKTQSYFMFDLGWLDSHNAIVTSAEVNARLAYSPACTNQDPQHRSAAVSLWPTNRINSHTTWNTRPGLGAKSFGSKNVMAGYSAACPAVNLGWSVGSWVKDLVDANGPSATVGLLPDSDTNPYGWKEFDHATMIVHYDILPTAPTGLATLDTSYSYGCSRVPNEAYLPTATPTLRANVFDADGDHMPVEFEWFVRNGGMIGYKITSQVASNSPAVATIPAGDLHDGSQIYWRARAEDTLNWGPFSAWCDVTIDLTPPGVAPGVTSETYPSGVMSGGVGVSGTFTFSSGGVADVVGYRYGFGDNQPQTPVAAATPGGDASVSITPPGWGPQQLQVQTVDRAGNLSPIATYSFLVGKGTPPVAYWPMDGYNAATTSPDANGHTLAVTGIGAGAVWTTGRVGDAVQFDGTSADYATATGGRPIDTASNFSISAWARLDRIGTYAAVASMDGVHSPGFQLQATPGGKWAFVMAGQDVDDSGTGSTRVESADPVVPGVWTHLVGAYDASSHVMNLYVNGRPNGTGAHTSTWSAPGPVTVGRSLSRGAHSDFFPGAIDEVRLYDRVLAQSETSGSLDNVHDRATEPVVATAAYPLDDAAGATATDAATALRPATLAGDAAWTTGAVGPGAIHLGGTGYLTADGDAVRTENSYTVAARVQLAGLDGNDHVALSRAGGFELGYDGTNHAWTFTGPGGVVASSAIGSATTAWTHLAGVLDAADHELRLYVNGRLVARTDLVGAPAAASGLLQIGRAATGSYWTGSIDDVHAYAGAMTTAAVRDLWAHPVITPSTAYTGRLTRWFGHGGNNLTTSTGVVPAGFHIGLELGLPAPAGATDTSMLYACRNGAVDLFTSLMPNCEGKEVLGPIASVYNQPDDAVNLRPLYRCTTLATPAVHFDSTVDGCENARTEAVLGYVVGLRGLTRYYSDAAHDHFSSFVNVPADYAPEGMLGLIAATPQPGTVALYGCADGTDHFSSTDPTCGGGSAQALYYFGEIWTAPPGSASPPELHACQITSSGERFDSVDPMCEGQSDLGRLGYLAAQS